MSLLSNHIHTMSGLLIWFLRFSCNFESLSETSARSPECQVIAFSQLRKSLRTDNEKEDNFMAIADSSCEWHKT